jgi:hypothetical protein
MNIVAPKLNNWYTTRYYNPKQPNVWNNNVENKRALKYYITNAPKRQSRVPQKRR